MPVREPEVHVWHYSAEVSDSRGEGEYMLKTEFEAVCPCCRSLLVIDTDLKRVVRHQEPEREDKPELSEAERILAEAAARREALFEQSVSGRKYEVLLLRSQGKTVAEIAMMLSISKNTVQGHYRRAVRQVREALEARSANNGGSPPNSATRLPAS